MRKSILIMPLILGFSLLGRTNDSHGHKHAGDKANSSHKDDQCEKDKLDQVCKIKKDEKNADKKEKKDLK